MKQITLVLLFSIASLACSLTTDLPAPTSLPPTFTPDPAQLVTETASETPATALEAATDLPSLTPAPTLPTDTPMPSTTPVPEILLAYDNYADVELEDQVRGGVDGVWVSFRNVNDREEPVDVRTPQAETGLQTIYLARPGTNQRLSVVDLPASVEDSIYWSPDGRYMLYFLREGPGVSVVQQGLYLLNLDLSVVLRFYDIETLQPRGIPGHEPLWAPDSSAFLMVMPSGYATDVFVVNTDGSGFRNITNSPTYDFWASWSPDGTKIAFVSDRAACPTWEPGVAGSCDRPDATAPRGGNLYLYDVETEQVQKVNDTLVTGPPAWVDNRHIAVTSGSLDPLATSTELWLYDTLAGSGWQITQDDGALHTAATWSNDGQQVAYQEASDETRIVLADRLGEQLSFIDRYNFPRFGIAMDWSADGRYLAIGGRNGQCPYGIIVVNSNFDLVTAPATNLLACDPVYSPDGRYIAFMGIVSRPGTDAHQDLYTANPNGLGATNMTGRLQGQVDFIGWTGISEE